MLATAIGSYSLAAIALFAYFLSREAWLRNFGAPLAILGCVVQFTQLVVRFETTGIWPLLNLYGSLSLFAAMAVAIYVGFAFKYKLWFAGGFVLAVAAIALGVRRDLERRPHAAGSVAAIVLGEDPRADRRLVVLRVLGFVRRLVHLSAQVLCGARFRRTAARGDERRATIELGGVEFSGGLARRYAGHRSRCRAAGNPVAQWLAALPSLGQLDVIVYRAVAVGLPLISIGIITGAMWAKESWGAYWQWDPKETAALLTWIIYLAYMHLHTRHAWRGMRTNWVSVDRLPLGDLLLPRRQHFHLRPAQLQDVTGRPPASGVTFRGRASSIAVERVNRT